MFARPNRDENVTMKCEFGSAQFPQGDTLRQFSTVSLTV
jgi:hypothetical protein